MAAADSELGPTTLHPRSLNSLLVDSRRALPPDVSRVDDVPEGELEGESEFIAVSDDVAPLFEVRLLPSPARRVHSRDTSSRELLTDLFPTGFTSNTLSPLATAAAATTEADESKPASAQPLGEAEAELKGRQVWACLVPKAAVAATDVASSNGASDVDRETELHVTAETAGKGQQPLHQSWGPSHQPDGYSDLHQPKCDELDAQFRETGEHDATAEITGLGSFTAKTSTATRRADLGAPPPGSADPLATTRSKSSFVSDGGGHGVVVKTETAEVAGRERESDLKHALGRLVSRLTQSQERVKFLERNLEQAKHVESGRNALIQQITRLEEEAKHARRRLEIYRAEALEWREKRQALEADNERLGAELHSALGRNTRHETENRRKDALLAEVRKSTDARAENNSKFEAELHHKDQLLVEAGRDRRQAWQATSASAETGKMPSDLRFLRGDAGGQYFMRSDENKGFGLGVGKSDKKRSQSLADVGMTTTSADGGFGGLERTRRSLGPTEASLLQSVSLAEQYGDRHITRDHSPATGSSANRTVMAPPNEAVSRGQYKLGRSLPSDSGEGFSTKSDGAPTVPPPHAAVVTTDCPTPRMTPHTAFFDERGNGSNTWSHEDKEVLSPPREPQEPAKNFLTPGSGRRMSVVETPSPTARVRGREQCYEGDRQRHDSEGVKGALTGANPAWTDAPSSFGGRSSTAVERSRSSSGGVVGAAGGEEFVRNLHTFGREVGDEEGLGEEAHSHNEESRDQFPTGFDGRVIDGVGPRAEGHGTPAGDESSPVSGGWKLQQGSPHCPAAGHRRGRDMMSSRRSSLCGSGVGVSAEVAGEASRTSPTGVGGNSEDRRVSFSVGGDRFGGQQLTAEGAQVNGSPPSTAASVVSAADNRTLADRRRFSAPDGVSASETENRRQSTGGVQLATSSFANSRQRVESLASLLGNVDPPRGSGTEERSRREKRTPAPFATDAVEDELRPVREVERRLMLLQMEMSQLEAEQGKLVPKASKTMQARVRLQEIDSRLALLASESSGLRRILREKPWRV